MVHRIVIDWFTLNIAPLSLRVLLLKNFMLTIENN